MPHVCDQCGMDFPKDLPCCPKCDYGIHEQNRSRTYTQDIAHNRQTVAQASIEFYAALESAKNENYGYLRLIVGGGLIKTEVQNLLDSEKWRGKIISFELETPNTGAYLIKLS